jgi:hypothetical protein
MLFRRWPAILRHRRRWQEESPDESEAATLLPPIR